MNMKNNYNVGKRIKELRTIKGFSQEQLALLSDITPTYLGLIERNLKNPTIKVIEQLCDSLNISLFDFFSDSTSKGESTFDTLSIQIISQISSCTDEEKELILDMIKKMLKLKNLPTNKDE